MEIQKYKLRFVINPFIYIKTNINLDKLNFII